MADTELTAALAVANQLPMMSQKKVVWITDVRVSGNSSKDTLKDADYDLLKEYLTNPSPSTVLIILCEHLDKRRKISKLLLEHSLVVDFESLRENELEAWAADRFADAGTKVDVPAIRLLAELVGNSLRKLNLEIEKLITAALPDKIVTVENVEQLVGNTRQLSNFELTDSLLASDRTRSLQILTKVLDDGAEPVMLLGLLSYNFRRLMIAKDMMEEGTDRKEVSRVMRLPYSRQNSFLQTARRTERQRLKNILDSLHKTDIALKSSLGPPRLQVEFLIAQIFQTIKQKKQAKPSSLISSKLTYQLCEGVDVFGQSRFITRGSISVQNMFVYHFIDQRYSWLQFFLTQLLIAGVDSRAQLLNLRSQTAFG